MSKKATKLATPEEVLAKIPPAAVRAICEEDPSLRALADALDAMKLKKKSSEGNKENDAATGNKKNKATTRSKAEEPKKKDKLSGFEGRRRIVHEIERSAVRLLCEKMTQPLLAEAVTSLEIKCGEGNNPNSRAVLTKRLTEHISTALGGVGLATFLEKEASDDLISELAEVVPGLSESETEVSVEDIQAALEQEALVTFFESLKEEQLHDICYAMKNERPKGETRSRQVLAASIIADRPVAEIVAETEEAARKKEKSKKTKKVKLSKTKPKLREGVTYEDVFQWYYLDELQDYAREQGIKVSGTKKELILRVLAFLADPDAVRAQAAAPVRRRKSKKSKKTTKTTKTKKVTKPSEEEKGEEDNEEAASGEEEDQEEENVTPKPSEEVEEEEDEGEEEEGEEEDGEDQDE